MKTNLFLRRIITSRDVKLPWLPELEPAVSWTAKAVWKEGADDLGGGIVLGMTLKQTSEASAA